MESRCSTSCSVTSRRATLRASFMTVPSLVRKLRHRRLEALDRPGVTFRRADGILVQASHKLLELPGTRSKSRLDGVAQEILVIRGRMTARLIRLRMQRWQAVHRGE